MYCFPMRANIMSTLKRRINVSIYAQAQQLGFGIVGALSPKEGNDPRCQYYSDDAGNTYIVRWGILTIIAVDGEVYW